MGTYLGITGTGAFDKIVFVPLKRRFIAVQAIGHDNTGTFTSATVELQVSLDVEDPFDYTTVATISLTSAEEADLIQYNGVVQNVRINVTAITVAGDADLDVIIRSTDE